jgi:hypothetical protein
MLTLNLNIERSRTQCLGFFRNKSQKKGEVGDQTLVPGAVHLRVKTVGKIFENTGSIFSYYLVNTVIGTKIWYGVTGISRNTVGLPYRPFLDWAEKSDNFLDFLHCSFELSHSIHLGWSCYLFPFNPKSFQIFK